MGVRCSNQKRSEAFFQKAFLFCWCLSSLQPVRTGNDWYYENIAVGKPSTQVDTYEPYDASRANDGNPDGNLAHKSCSRTKATSDTWWVVDLLTSNYINAVQMKNRNTHTNGKLRDFYVYISETNPLPLPPLNGNNFTGEICLFHEGVLPPSGLQFLSCENDKGLKGRYAYIWKPGGTGQLFLCEFEALIIYPLREFVFTLTENKKSEVEPFDTESLSGATYTQCIVFCLNMVNVTVEMMQFNKDNGDCSCFETKPFEDMNSMANMTSHQSYDIIGRLI